MVVRSFDFIFAERVWRLEFPYFCMAEKSGSIFLLFSILVVVDKKIIKILGTARGIEPTSVLILMNTPTPAPSRSMLGPCDSCSVT